MSEQLKIRKQGKTWKIKSKFTAPTVMKLSNSDNQSNAYRLPSETDKHIEEQQLLLQLEEDLKDLFDKKEAARAQVE